VIYYGAAPGGFIPAVELTPRRAQELMPLGVYAPLALVQAFLSATGVLALFPHPAVLTVSGVAELPALVGQVFHCSRPLGCAQAREVELGTHASGAAPTANAAPDLIIVALSLAVRPWCPTGSRSSSMSPSSRDRPWSRRRSRGSG
jgi:hypothetical protein